MLDFDFMKRHSFYLTFLFILSLSTTLISARTSELTSLPIFDLPRLNGIVIDGNTKDWADQGLRVEILAATDGAQQNPKEFSGSFRAAWNEIGLLLAVEVRDLNSQEFSDIAYLHP